MAIDMAILTAEQIQMIVSVLSEKVVQLKGKNGTEFTQARLCEIIKLLETE